MLKNGVHIFQRAKKKQLSESKIPACLFQEEAAACLPFVQVVLWISSSFSSPQAPRHFEIERKIINLLLLFSYFQFENKKSGVYHQPIRHTFTLSSCKLCHIYTPRHPFKRTPRLEIDKDLLRRGMKTTHSYTLRFFSSSCPLALLLFPCCLFPCTAS